MIIAICQYGQIVYKDIQSDEESSNEIQKAEEMTSERSNNGNN